MTPSKDIARLIEIMERLRTPDGGCPWDLAQDFATIAPYTIEEAYEVADAIERGDLTDLRDELGDLLLQVVFHSRMAEEQNEFAFGDVVEAITRKMIRRHPHVFGDGSGALGANGVSVQWAAIKAQEKAERRAARAAQGVEESVPGHLDGVPRALPASTRAVKLQAAAATVGFDWPDAVQVIAKINEELGETEQALAEGDEAAIADEIGDLLFAVINLARHVRVDPEAALRATNAKFERRFRFIEDALTASGRALPDASLDEMEALWQRAKFKERGEA